MSAPLDTARRLASERAGEIAQLRLMLDQRDAEIERLSRQVEEQHRELVRVPWCSVCDGRGMVTSEDHRSDQRDRGAGIVEDCGACHGLGTRCGHKGCGR